MEEQVLLEDVLNLAALRRLRRVVHVPAEPHGKDEVVEPTLTTRPLLDSGSLNARILHDIEEPVELARVHVELLRPGMEVCLLLHVVTHNGTHGQQEMQDLMQFKTAISIPLLLRKKSERRLGRRVYLCLRRITDTPCRRVMRRRCVTLHCHTALSLCRVQEAGILSCHSSSYLLSRSLTRSTSLWKPSLTMAMESGQTPPNASMIV